MSLSPARAIMLNNACPVLKWENKGICGRLWWLTSITPIVWRMRQEDYYNFKANLEHRGRRDS